MIVLADREECIGAGSCVDTVPQVFELGDDGLVRVLQPEFDASLASAVEDAVAMCPVEALSIDNGDVDRGGVTGT